MDHQALREKLASGAPLRVLFLNDIGFQYGAGLAQMRQVQSFLAMGHVCGCLCWNGGLESTRHFALPGHVAGTWEGFTTLLHLHEDKGASKPAIIDGVLDAVAAWHADVVIVGNLHGARWPLELLLRLRDLPAAVAVYLHDLYLLTGRCAYPAGCQLHLTGCDHRCPTLDEYPPLRPAEIRAAWELRRAIFTGPQAVPLVANSRWTMEQARQALPGHGFLDVAHLSVDETVFAPLALVDDAGAPGRESRELARHLLGLPQDATLVAMGAVNLHEKRKGWEVVKELVPALAARGARVLLFGENSLGAGGVHSLGLVNSFRIMPLVYAACDIYVTTSMEEAFGQTIVEAQACARPVCAFAVGGVTEACQDGVTARLSPAITPDGMLAAVEGYLTDPSLRLAHGRAGRALVESRFSLAAQGARWMETLHRLAGVSA